MSPARVLDCTLADYLGDDVLPDQLTLNATIANILLSQSPLHAWTAHPRLGGGTEDEPTPEMDLGTLLHRLLLGTGPPIIAVPADDWRTKAAKEQRDQARAAGALPVLEKKLDIADAITRRVSGRLRERGILLDGDSEVKVAWEEENGVHCRGMMDHLKVRDTAVVWDLKTGGTANPAVCARKVLDLGYHVQAAAYVSAVEKLHPELVGRVEMQFIFAEVRPPYAVTIARLGNGLKQLGTLQWEKAVRIWAECLANDQWPAYGDDVQTLEAPAWALQQLETELYGERVS